MVTQVQIAKSGYKQTEVGMIPDDWEVKRLGEMADVYDGTHQTPTYVEYGIPFYSVETVTNNDFKNTKFISEKDHKLLTRTCRIEKGNILMTRIGSIGDCKLIDWEVEASFYVSLALLKITKGISPAFICQYSKGASFKREIEIRSLQWAIPKKINLGDISEIRIALPRSEEEQSAIARVLSDTDTIIELLDKLLTKKKNLKQGAMQELLTGKRRLPGFSGKWGVTKLGDISEIKTGKKNNEDKVDGGIYPFFVRSQTVERINSYSFEGEAILVPGEGGIGSIFHYINGRFDYHQRVYKISNFAENVNGKFVYYSMLINFNRQAMKNSVKATVDSLRLPTFQEFELLVPPTEKEQSRIVQVLSDMDAEITELEQKRDKYKELKTGMMQQLLTGKIRLK